MSDTLSVGVASAGMIVFHGDHYADRPWCRREIRTFQTPKSINHKNYYIPPIVVVNNMKGAKIARTIPELGHAPYIHWQDGAAKRITSTILREILLGLFLFQLSQRQNTPQGAITINRPPDPVMVNRIINDSKNINTILYPGYGLSRTEAITLTTSFPTITFKSFSGITNSDSPKSNPTKSKAKKQQLLCLHIGNAKDLIQYGMLDEHHLEILTRLLKPLLAENFSLAYGGILPDKLDNSLDPTASFVNYTHFILNLVLGDLNDKQNSNSTNNQTTRLYNIQPWPESTKITKSIISQWIDICSFLSVTKKDCGSPAEDLDDTWYDKYPSSQAQYLSSLCLSKMRELTCGTMSFPLPEAKGEKSTENIQTTAHLFMGGKTEKSSGIMPGIFEEFLFAAEHNLNARNSQKTPIFLIGCSGGATGKLADWLLAPPNDTPKELTANHYAGKDEAYENLLQEYKNHQQADFINQRFQKLHQILKNNANDLAKLLHNGLSQEENKQLLSRIPNFHNVCSLIHKSLIK